MASDWDVVKEEPLSPWQVVGEVPLDQKGGGVGNWAGTRAINSVSSFAGGSRGLADLLTGTAQKLGVPENVARAIAFSNPVTAVGRFMPTTEQMRKVAHDNLPVKETNLPGTAGKIVDAGVESVLQAPVFPGSIARNLLPAFVGGAASEGAGLATHGTPWEPIARIAVGGAAGGGTALLQNAAGNVAKGVSNTLFANARNVDNQAGRIIARAAENDGTTIPALLAQHQNFPAGTPVAVAGGENIRGALRGSIAAPGPARTTAADAFENYRVGGDARVGTAINTNVSNLPPVAIRTNDLAVQRNPASGPAYEASGVPNKIVATETVTPTAPITRASSIVGADGIPLQVTEQPPPTITRTFNTPNLSNDSIKALLNESKDVQTAIAAARRLPQFKDLPSNSMVMLDKAYKHLGGMENEAIRAGNGARAFDIGNVRSSLRTAIEVENPKYGEALKTYSDPSKLIDAANLGRDLFAKNVNPQEARRIYSKLPDDQKKEALGGMADWLRTRAANSDRATAGERVWNNQNIRDRLQAVLPPDDFARFSSLMEQEAQGGRTFRDVFRGSRTPPMALEAGDNASQMGGVGLSLLRGKIGSALMKALEAGGGRLAEGRTQAVNNRVAQALVDPAQMQALGTVAERQRLLAAQTAANRRNALMNGLLMPGAMSPGLLGE
jgi:hypothetical protein